MKKVTDLKRDEGILCTTEAEAKAICRLMDEAGLKRQEGNSYLNNKWWKTYIPAVFCPAIGQFVSQDWAEQMGYNLHPASDFIQEKKIVGYVLKDDKYLEAVKAITGYDFDFTKVWGGKDPQLCYEKLKEANVLDIFMKPVYEEEKTEFKVGDVVVITVYQFGDDVGTVTEILKCSKNNLVLKSQNPTVTGNFHQCPDAVRHATPEEIKAYNSPKLPKINGYEGKEVNGNLNWGCKHYNIAFVKEICENFKSVTMKDGTAVTPSDMNQIRKYLSK